MKPSVAGGGTLERREDSKSFRPKAIVRRVMFAGGAGLMLAACGSSMASQMNGQRLHHEVLACQQIGAPSTLPMPASGNFSRIFVKSSLISALANSDNAELQDVGRELRNATQSEMRSGKFLPVARALDKGIEECHRLGLSTTRLHPRS